MLLYLCRQKWHVSHMAVDLNEIKPERAGKLALCLFLLHAPHIDPHLVLRRILVCKIKGVRSP